MNRAIDKTFFGGVVAFLACVIASTPASAQSSLSKNEVAGRINAANTLLRDGKVEEALEAYRAVVPGEQQKEELKYNLAVAEYRGGDIDAAERLFGEMAGTSRSAISSESRYNLGNCQYAKAVEWAGTDKSAAIERLRQAIANFRGSLRGNPNNADARANIELAGELIRKLEQEQEQQKQTDEQQQQDPQSSPDENQDPKHEDQKDKSDQGQSDPQKSEQEQQDKAEQNPPDQSGKSESQDSKANSRETPQQTPDESASKQQPHDDEKGKQQQAKNEEQDGKSGNQPPPSPAPGAEKKQNQPPNRQKESTAQQRTEDQSQAEEKDAKNPSVPTGELKAAGEQDAGKRADGSVAMPDPAAKEGLMTREEALKMLQAVRDRDMLRRLQQQRQERSRHIAVERDW